MRQGEGKSTNGGISRSTKRDNTRIRRYETLSLLFGILLIAASFFFIQGNWLTLEDPLAWIFLVVGITMVTITVHAIDRKKESILEHYFTSAADFLGVCVITRFCYCWQGYSSLSLRCLLQAPDR
jgi:hypothetical protein